MTSKYTIEDYKIYAKNIGVKLLNKRVGKLQDKVKWICKKKHIIKVSLSDFKKRAHPCKECFRISTIEFTEEDCRKAAKNHNGKFFKNKKYKPNDKHKWQCECGYTWRATPNTIKKGHWCNRCAGRENLTLNDLKKTAKQHGGFCLGKKFKNSESKIKWKCKFGHIWKAKIGNVRHGYWCPVCGKVIPNTIKDAQKLAKSNDGNCLSKKYKSAHEKLRWKCEFNHTWRASYDSVRRGTWCPKCNKFVAEDYCRKIFESFFKKKFSSKKPDWLINPKTKRKLQLDGFCEKLRIAFEYNGGQHYKLIPNFRMTDESLKMQKYRDRVKKRLCKKNNIKLIIIKEIYPFNKQKCKKIILKKLERIKL